MKYCDIPLSEFTGMIASTAPAPGGGGAAAAAAAVGIALGDMVGELTVGKKKYAAVEDQIRKAMTQAESLRLRFLALIDEDENNFLPLSKAYAIPKDDPKRDAEMERCLKLATSTPAELFELCCEAIDLQETFARIGSKLVISDAATGVEILRGALYGAAMNVRVNTRLMKDRLYAETIEKRIETLLPLYAAKADKIFESIMEKFNG